MKIVITIEDDVRKGRTAVKVEGEKAAKPGEHAAEILDLIETSLLGHFHPVMSYYRPNRSNGS